MALYKSIYLLTYLLTTTVQYRDCHCMLAAGTIDVSLRYLQNGLQLNQDKSEALIAGTSNQLPDTASAMSSVTVADVDLPVSEEMKVLGVVLD